MTNLYPLPIIDIFHFILQSREGELFLWNSSKAARLLMSAWIKINWKYFLLEIYCHSQLSIIIGGVRVEKQEQNIQIN